MPEPPALSEFAVIPTAVIVHDPTRTLAFDAMSRAGDREVLHANFLFADVPNKAIFAQQHGAFVDAIRRSGIPVHYLRDLLGDRAAGHVSPTNPNQVYTRDPLITFPWLPDAYMACRMKPAIRTPESRPLAMACEELGLKELPPLPEDLWLEGGDVIPFVREGRRTLLVGYGPRTHKDAVYALKDLLVPDHLDEIIGIQLADWRINLDGGMLPVAEDVLLAQPESLLSGFQLAGEHESPIEVLSMFRDLGFGVLDVSVDESYRQACNCLCLGQRNVICYDLSERVVGKLRALDIDVTPIPGSELVKGTGGPRCMSRPIYLDTPAVPVLPMEE